jgi:C4-dicarboxylate transporter DctM subunit
MDILVLFGSLTFFLTCSIPIGIALGLATHLTLATTSDIPLILIAQNAFAALDSFPCWPFPSSCSRDPS